MLQDMIKDLMQAKTEEEREAAYKALEKVGMDRLTANLLVKELKGE